MPGTIVEFVRSRATTMAGKASRYERHYRVHGTDDEDEAMSLLVAEAPITATIGGQLLADATYELGDLDEGMFEASVQYRKRTNPGESRYNFEIAGQSQHISYSRQTVQAVGGTVNDNGQAIGFDGETVQGCDIIVPTYNWSETHVFLASSITQAYRDMLFSICGTVNNNGFKGRAAGEVLFLGCSGNERDDSLWEINFRFSAAPNQTNLAIGGLTGINKKGWEHLWLYFAGGIATQRYIKKPVAAYVERVYDYTNFAGIGIGT